MGSRAGLKKVTKSVRGKHGTVRRTYWVNAKQATSKFLRRHGKKIAVVAGTAALAGSAYLAHKHRAKLSEHAGHANKQFAAFRRGTGATLTKKLVSAAGSKLADHIGESFGERAGGAIGRMVGGKHGESIGRLLGGTLGSTAATHLTESRIDRAATAASKRVRESGYGRRGGRFVAK